MLSAIRRWGLSQVLPGIIRDVRDGRLGPAWLGRAYRALEGLKTPLSLGLAGLAGLVEVGVYLLPLAAAAGVCAPADCAAWRDGLGASRNALLSVAVAGLALGLYDGAVRFPAPMRPGEAPAQLRGEGTRGKLHAAGALVLALAWSIAP